MTLQQTSGPCAFCFREAADVEDPVTHEPVGAANVIPAEVTQTTKICIKCSRRFCLEHSSPVDQVDCCYECLPFEAISEMKTPLVDTENNIKKGCRLVPTGPGYKTLPRALSDLEDDELEQFIKNKSEQIHQVEQQRDFLYASRSAANLEKSEREEALRRTIRASGYKVKPINKGIKITGTTATGPGGIKGTNSAVAGLDLMAFLKFASSPEAKAKLAELKKSGAPPSKLGTVGAPSGAIAGAPKVDPQAKSGPVPPAKPSVAPTGGGAPSSAITPPPLSANEEALREAEIEAILNEKGKIDDDDIPF